MRRQVLVLSTLVTLLITSNVLLLHQNKVLSAEVERSQRSLKLEVGSPASPLDGADPQGRSGRVAFIGGTRRSRTLLFVR